MVIITNIAIIGCGAIAKNRHAPAVFNNPKANLYAVCDTNKKNADALAQIYCTKAVYNLDELLRDETVDAVIVCTPERFHKEHVIAALEAKKDVLCEKPLAMNATEGEAIIDAWRRSNQKLMVAFSQRMYEEHRLAKKLLKQGVIGKPIAFRTELAHHGAEYATILEPSDDFYDKRLLDIGDIVISVGCHRMDLIYYLFDSKIKAVNAYTTTIDKKYADGSPIQAADHAMMIVELENGLSGTAWISWCAYGAPEVATLIYGTEGSMSIYEAPGIVVRKRDGEVKSYEIEDNPNAGQLVTGNFLDMINGDGAACCDGLDGQVCMLVMEAVDKSNREGQWVAVREIS